MKGSLIRAAGGVLWRTAGSGSEEDIEIAVVHRPRYDDWSLPKGKLAPGESALDAAVREVLEETGYRVRLGEPLGTTRYRRLVNGVDRPKVVHWWAMEATSGEFTPNEEVDALRWVPLDTAPDVLGTASDLTALRRFVDAVKVPARA